MPRMKDTQQTTERILVVDDSRPNRLIVKNILEKVGYDVILAEDGEQALALAEEQSPDLILLDIVMPKMNGYEVCEELIQRRKAVAVPIIFLSSLDEKQEMIKGLDLGASDYITKPFDREEVLARVRAQLKIRALTRSLLLANRQLEEKQQRIDEDLKSANVMQRSLLPSEHVGIEHMEAAWAYIPCEAVGGDLFHFCRLDESHWGVYIFDVSGHGVPAAMVSVSVSQMLRPDTGLILKKKLDPPPFYEITSPGEVLSILDQQFPMERYDRYFTMVFAVVNVVTGEMTYSNAAHPPPLLLRKSGELEKLEAGGTIIGLGGVLPFDQSRVRLEDGDRLFLYSDGIVEYQNPAGELFGDDRFRDILVSSATQSVDQTVQNVMSSLKTFSEQQEPLDDISLVGLEYKSP